MDGMKDITDSVFRFRESVRHNWNTYFQDSDESMGPEIQDAFDLVEQGLFQGIILSACPGVNAHIEYGKGRALPFIRVVPRSETLEMMLQTGDASRGYMAWNPPSPFKINKNTKLELIRFFDWCPYNQVSMSLVEVYISESDTDLIPVGTHALAVEHETRFLFSRQNSKRWIGRT